MANKIIQMKDGSDNLYPISDKYSTSEIQVGTWTDGSAIYRKVITDTVASGAGWHSKQLGISRDTVVRVDAFYIGSTGVTYHLPFYESSSYFFNYAIDGNTFSYYHSGASYGGNTLQVIIEYTKS